MNPPLWKNTITALRPLSLIAGARMFKTRQTSPVGVVSPNNAR
jgi:hypothetical protein